ncbi:hypothetical protein H0H92_014225 [Tricholoma furcatifolium]|nr:hypothetical protein H0H92_014225 [Tricholoma furcatifolium]
MTSYFRSWLTGAVPEAVPTLNRVSPPPEDHDEGSDTATEGDDDTPPAFPSLNSAQRVQTQAPKILTDSELMPPPPLPRLAQRIPGVDTSARSTNASSSLTVLQTTEKPAKPSKNRKVVLAPGHSPLDWAQLKSSGTDLRGVDTLMRIPPSVLKQHNKRDDAWSAFYGKVYNITPYLAFHPGGERELMRVAGRDGTKLFGAYHSIFLSLPNVDLVPASTHAWVSAEMMLDACLVGFLIPEPSES